MIDVNSQSVVFSFEYEVAKMHQIEVDKFNNIDNKDREKKRSEQKVTNLKTIEFPIDSIFYSMAWILLVELHLVLNSSPFQFYVQFSTLCKIVYCI